MQSERQRAKGGKVKKNHALFYFVSLPISCGAVFFFLFGLMCVWFCVVVLAFCACTQLFFGVFLVDNSVDEGFFVLFGFILFVSFLLYKK